MGRAFVLRPKQAAPSRRREEFFEKNHPPSRLARGGGVRYNKRRLTG